jgi:ABC-2 type transport system ATP-binding protein
MDAIATHGLTKHYGAQVALRGLDLRVPTGRLFGFLGPNGAGKTTALRLLLGLLRATSGRAEVLGRDAWREGRTLRAEVGYLPGDVRFYGWLTGRQTLAFLDAARQHRGRTELGRLSERFDLDLDRKVRNYSRGMKQKLGLIAALMHRPQLLILDEPTVSLDPLMRETLYAELRAVVAEGRTVVFSSHTLAEVDALCDDVAILRDGQLIEHERIVILRQRALRRVELRLRDSGGLVEPLPAGLRVLRRSDAQLSATWTGPADRLLQWLAHCSVQDVTVAPPDLADLFLEYYTDRPACPGGPGGPEGQA